jgi:hypothetical protein
MRLRLRLALPALGLCLAACDGGGGTDAEAPGGEYIAVLESPHGAEGAAILEVPADGVESITATSLSLFRQPIAGGTRLVLVREPAGRLEFRVRMAAGSRPPEVRVVEVVDGEDRQRASVDGYEVSFTRVREDQ